MGEPSSIGVSHRNSRIYEISPFQTNRENTFCDNLDALTGFAKHCLVGPPTFLTSPVLTATKPKLSWVSPCRTPSQSCSKETPMTLPKQGTAAARREAAPGLGIEHLGSPTSSFAVSATQGTAFISRTNLTGHLASNDNLAQSPHERTKRASTTRALKVASSLKDTWRRHMIFAESGSAQPPCMRGLLGA